MNIEDRIFKEITLQYKFFGYSLTYKNNDCTIKQAVRGLFKLCPNAQIIGFIVNGTKVHYGAC